MVVSIVALVVAAGGTAIAASSLTKKEKRQSKNIATKQVKRLAPGLAVATARAANTANTANTASSATTASNASLLEGSGLAQVAPGGLGFSAGCSPTTTLATCGSLNLTLNRTADVMVIATTQWYSAEAGGSSVQAHCNIRRDATSTFNVDFGSTAHDTDADQTETFALTHVFTDVPAGTATFEFRCAEDALTIELVQIRVVGVVVG